MRRLQHVAVTFPPGREEDLRGFYGGVLGLAETPLPAGTPPGVGWVWFATDDEGVELHFIPHPRAPDPERIHHLCLEVDDLAGVRAALRAAGHAPHDAGTPIPGRERLFVRDPFGNLVEVVRIAG